jgi:UrcA family protein
MDEAVKCIDSAPQPGAASAPGWVPTAQSDFLTPKEISMNTTTTSLSFRAALATAMFGAFSLSLATVCTAAETDPPQTTVKYGDLNVSNPQGAAALYTRIQRAALLVCLPFDMGNLSSKARMAACVHQAIAAAVAKVDQPALFDVYNARNDRPASIVLAASR